MAVIPFEDLFGAGGSSAAGGGGGYGTPGSLSWAAGWGAPNQGWATVPGPYEGPYAQYMNTLPYSAVYGAYQDYLGRPGTPDEIMSHLGYGKAMAPKNVTWAINQIARSPEAFEWQAKRNAGGTTTGGGSTGTSSVSGFSSGGGGEGEEYDWSQWLGGPGGLFDDPATATFMQILTNRLNALGTMPSIPGVESFRSRANRRMTQLDTPLNLPEVDQYKAALEGRALQLAADPLDNEWMQKVMDYGTTRFSELQQPPFTATDEKAQEVQAYDQLEQDRQEARRQVTERLAARGIAAGSGVIEDALQQVDKRFDILRSQRTNELLLYRTEEAQARKNQAMNLGAALAGLRQDEIEWLDSRDREGLQALGELAGIGLQQQVLEDTRQGAVMDIATALANMDLGVFNLADSRAREQVMTAAMMPDLVERRLQLALAALNGGTASLAPFGASLMGLLGQSGSFRAQAPTTDWGSLYGGLGQLIGAFGNWNKTSTTKK